VLLCVAIGIGISEYQRESRCYRSTPPLRSINVTMDLNQSELLIEKLKTFSDQNGFIYEVNYYTPNRKDFSVWMRRKDTEIVANGPFDSEEFRIHFYNNDCIHPTSASDIIGLVNDLKDFVSQIPSATITEEK
jgi:hypothetical protein